MPKNQTKKCSGCGQSVSKPHSENCPRPKTKKKGRTIARAR